MYDPNTRSVMVDGVFIDKYDVVIINEVKCTYRFSVPGFQTLRSRMCQGDSLQEGVAVLCAHWLSPGIRNVDTFRE